MKSISRILGGLISSRVGEEYPKGRWGNNIPRETCTLYFTFEHAATSERVLHECAYNSETNGDPGLTPSPLVSTRCRARGNILASSCPSLRKVLS